MCNLYSMTKNQAAIRNPVQRRSRHHTVDQRTSGMGPMQRPARDSPARAFMEKEACYCAEIEDFDFTGAEPG
jgi:hypothetical protein